MHVGFHRRMFLLLPHVLQILAARLASQFYKMKFVALFNDTFNS